MPVWKRGLFLNAISVKDSLLYELIIIIHWYYRTCKICCKRFPSPLWPMLSANAQNSNSSIQKAGIGTAHCASKCVETEEKTNKSTVKHIINRPS